MPCPAARPLAPRGRRNAGSRPPSARTARIFAIGATRLSPRELSRRACGITLARGLSVFQDAELDRAPTLDRARERDPCRRVSRLRALAEMLHLVTPSAASARPSQ